MSAIKTVYSSKLSDRAVLLQFTKCKLGKKTACKKCHWGRLTGFDNRSFRCPKCWSKVSVSSRTWLAKSRLPLRFWYEIAWCFILAHSARKAGRLLDVPYKSVWSSYQRIRKALLTTSRQKRRFGGTIELDESFYGGTFKNLRKKVRMELRRLGLNKRGGGAKYRKQPVFGVFKRNGQVYLEPIPETTANVLAPIIKKKVNLGSDVFSDTGTWYTGLVRLCPSYR